MAQYLVQFYVSYQPPNNYHTRIAEIVNTWSAIVKATYEYVERNPYVLLEFTYLLVYYCFIFDN
jgi:hypothetical protein